ncbi:MAG: ribonuclease D [Dokdonella sp.]
MPIWIDHAAALHDLLPRLGTRLFMDTEFMRTDTFLPKLALIQIELDGDAALIDPTGDIDATAFGALISDPGHVCVMHSASEDLEALRPIARGGIGTLFDTQIAAAFAGFGPGLSYQKLVTELTGVVLPKAETRSDWLKRPLTAEQIDYAAKDVTHLPTLHEQLAKKLAERGYADWHAEDCARLADKARRDEIDQQPQKALRAATDWSPDQQALLRRLLLWRESRARSLDKPRPWILDDARALDLVARPPRDDNDLYERGKGLRAFRSAQRAEVIDLLREPIRTDEREFEPIPPAPSAQERKAISALKESVISIATELDLPDGLLCSRRHLETLWATRAWPPALEGWRRGVLHDALTAKLPE